MMRFFKNYNLKVLLIAVLSFMLGYFLRQEGIENDEPSLWGFPAFMGVLFVGYWCWDYFSHLKK